MRPPEDRWSATGWEAWPETDCVCYQLLVKLPPRDRTTPPIKRWLLLRCFANGDVCCAEVIRPK